MPTRFLCGFALLVLCVANSAAAGDPSVLAAQRRRVEVVESVSPSVVAIFSSNGQGGGSGVLISADGYALTNFHVTNGTGNFMKCGLDDGKLYDAVIVGIDPTGDLALIKLIGRDDFRFAKIGDSDRLQAGHWVYAMGNPFLLATDFKPTVTYGIVSGVHRYQYPAGTILEYTDCIQTDSSINPGNSGGPLFNDDGELVGINGRGSFEKRGRVNSGAGYAISINQAMNFLDHLKSGRIVDHATLGATVISESDGSVTVDQILEQSEAFRRGVRTGDEIVSFAGRPIRSVNQYKNILGIYPKGWKLPLEYRRDQEKTTVYVRLRGLHSPGEIIPGRPKRGNPAAPPKEEPEIPEQFQDLYVKKDGYANYHFNTLEQQRVLAGLDRLGDYSGKNGAWEIAGRDELNRPFSASIDRSEATLSYLDGEFAQTFGGADIRPLPPETGGLLHALRHLRLFVSQREFLFSDFYYLGSEPLDSGGETVDVLVSELTSVIARWYFSRATGEFLGFDVRLANDQDECEIRFLEFGEFEGLQFPTRWTIRSGDLDYAFWMVDRAALADAPSPRSENNAPVEPAKPNQESGSGT